MAIKTNLKSLRPRTEQYAKKFDLVSGGYTNRKAWPEGKITVLPWDTEVDEWFVTAQSMGEPELLRGILERVVSWNGASVDDVPVTEMMSILLMARSLSTGGALRYISSCPQCQRKEDETIRVPEELEPMGVKGPDYPGYDVITLPECKDIVAIRPLLMKDDALIDSRPAGDKLLVSDSLLRKVMPVVTVNEGRPDTLEEVVTWYRALPPRDARYLLEMQDELSPQLNRRIPHKCANPQCRLEFHHMIKFDSEFFRSRSAGESGAPLETDVPARVDRKGVPPQSSGGTGSDADKV